MSEMSVAVHTRMYFACLMVMFVAVGPILVMMLNLMREDNVDLFIGVFMAFFISMSILMFAWRKKHQTQEQENVENEMEKACDCPPAYETVVAMPPPYQNIQQFIMPSYTSSSAFILHSDMSDMPSTSRWGHAGEIDDFTLRQELITYPSLSELPPYESNIDISSGRPPDTTTSSLVGANDEQENV